jgi:hypothetical protein
MLTTRYKVMIKAPINLDLMNEVCWYAVLKDIYSNKGPNFDGYVSDIKVSDSFDSVTIECYTLEGPEDDLRLKDLRDANRDWAGYRKTAVVNAVLSNAYRLGCIIDTFHIEDA